WRFDAEPGADTTGTLIARTGEEGPLNADVEGLAIYEGESADQGYLIASSQGDNTYAVFDRAAPHAFLGRFQVQFEGEIIGDTDGIEVTSRALGERFPKGMLVVQDGFVRTGGREGAQTLTGERRQQRFAYVSWADVEAALGLGSETIATAPASRNSAR
ncbi:MAG: phytase, partial [Pseudomonadota bacterium]